MADLLDLKVFGLKEANDALKQLPRFVKRRVQPVMNETAEKVANGARSRVSRRTGQLLRDIDWQARPGSVSAVVGIAFQSFYWKFLEYGTVKMEARPFLRPAVEAIQAGHEERLTRALIASADDVEAQAAVSGRLL